MYGLAADAGNADAVAKIFAAKADLRTTADRACGVGRGGKGMGRLVARCCRQTRCCVLARPMTLIVKRASHVLDAVTGGRDTVGLRVPSHPVAQAVLVSSPAMAPCPQAWPHHLPTSSGR